MKKSGMVLASCIAAACFNMPVMAEREFIDCNMAGAGNFGSQERGQHVFWARLSNNGKGDGGESIDVTMEGGEVATVTCVDTADEDTGGVLTLQSGVVIEGVLPEGDNGPGAARPRD
jgi:hypothetical protein